ncbi:MAG: hypothetical protein V1808_00265 [Candidatus Daviesbacteria bacterium]
MPKFFLSKNLLFLTFLLILQLFLPSSILAQTPMSVSGGTGLEVTAVYSVADSKTEDGDIVIMTDKGVTRASQSFSPLLFGILQPKALLVYRESDTTKQPVTRSGVAEVNVTTYNGPIKPGDFITSSQIPGKGQKATYSGYVIGVALTSLNEGEGQKFDYVNAQNPKLNKQVLLGKVKVALKFEYAEIAGGRFSKLLGPLSAIFSATVQDPDRFIIVVKYFIAGIVVFLGFVISFFASTRTLPKAAEAVGRNPLAKGSIYFTVALAIAFSVVILGIAMVAAIIIVRI